MFNSTYVLQNEQTVSIRTIPESDTVWKELAK